MDPNWLSTDYLLELKVGKRYYIFKDKYGEPFIDINLIDTAKKIESNENVLEISKNDIKKKELLAMCDNFTYEGNYIIGNGYNISEPVNLILPTTLVDEIVNFLKSRKKPYVTKSLLFYLCGITQFTYQFVNNSIIRDFDYKESVKAIYNIQNANSIIIKGTRDYSIKDLSILNLLKSGIETTFKNLDQWNHWSDYLNNLSLDEDSSESKILQKIAYNVDLVLRSLKPKGSQYSRDLIIGHILAWSNLDINREGIGTGIEDRNPDVLRKWAGSLKSAYNRKNQSNIVKSKKEVTINNQGPVKEKLKATNYESLNQLLKKYGIEHLETDITNLLYMIPTYTDQYPEVNLEKEVIIKFDQLLPYPKNRLSEGVRAHIENLLLEPIKQWPFDLMNHVIKFDEFLKAMKVASKLDRLQIISKSLFLADIFIDESIQSDTAMMKVKFWLSQNRNINSQFPQKYSDR